MFLTAYADENTEAYTCPRRKARGAATRYILKPFKEVDIQTIRAVEMAFQPSVIQPKAEGSVELEVFVFQLVPGRLPGRTTTSRLGSPTSMDAHHRPNHEGRRGGVIFVKNRSRSPFNWSARGCPPPGRQEDLLFVEALKDYVVVHTRQAQQKEAYTIHSTMKEVERKLSGDVYNPTAGDLVLTRASFAWLPWRTTS